MAFRSSDSSNFNRRIRNLGHQKTSRTLLGQGTPEDGLGNDGDFRLHTTDTGVKLYAKYNGKWYGFSPDSESDKEVFSTDDSKGLAENGNVKFPGGFIMQWGKETTSGTTKVITFSMEFPHACRGAFITIEDAGSGGEAEAAGIVTSASITTTGFTANTESTWDSIYWLAIGN